MGRRLALLILSSLLGHVSRWTGLFLASSLVTQLGAGTMANQGVGVALFAPLLLGIWLTSSVGSRASEARIVMTTVLALLPISAAMTVLVATGAVRVWMVFGFAVAYGVGGAVNMTALRELLFLLAPADSRQRVLNIEIVGLSAATMLGPLVGGSSIDTFGIAGAFAVPTLLVAASAAALACFLRAPADDARAVGSAGSVGSAPEARAVARPRRSPLRESPRLLAILAVTVVCNVCYFAFLPLVPVVAVMLRAGPTMAGMIGAAAGATQLLVGLVLVLRPLRNAGRAYVLGVAICLCCLAVLSQTRSVLWAVVTLAVAGTGQALFAAGQAVLPVSVVPPESRPAVLGTLGTTIGVALPTGMLVLGVTSTLLGPRPALLVSAVTGVVALGTILFLNPHLARRT